VTLAEDFEDFIKLLNRHKVEYMVVGGYALAFHGKPRHTGALDILINISEDNALPEKNKKSGDKGHRFFYSFTCLCPFVYGNGFYHVHKMKLQLPETDFPSFIGSR